MKCKVTTLTTISFLIILLTSACRFSRQMIDIDSKEVAEYSNDYFVYEDEQLSLHYNFWSEGGIPIIEILNTSRDTIVVDLNKSQFVHNDETLVYSIFKESKKPYLSRDRELFSIYDDLLPGDIQINPDSMIALESFPVALLWLRVGSGKEAAFVYTEDESPINFNFSLSYKTKSDSLMHTVQNTFWISKIERLSASEFSEKVSAEELKADKFYLFKYTNPELIEMLEIAASVLSVTIP